ncbi:protein saal1-like [Neoarius graeffei]|uniref:protein saal1-like n=1 Tax=Neoarius graeffei TaxID=443677 RepID=UPI00298C802F|nr:protein saal1-like [Neoarius graeffei]
MDRNPLPPPDRDDETAEEDDAIGETVYSKHWLFSTLTRLIQMVTEQDSEQGEGLTELSDELEEELCKVWDMAMDKDVAGFLQEFKTPDILLGVIAKSHNPRLTEICIGILGNMACFPETCAYMSKSKPRVILESMPMLRPVSMPTFKFMPMPTSGSMPMLNPSIMPESMPMP